MIKSVIVPVQQPNNTKEGSRTVNRSSQHRHRYGSKEKLESSTNKHVNRGSDKSSSHKHGQSSEHNNKNSSSSFSKKPEIKPGVAVKKKSAAASGLGDFSVKSIDLVSKLKWPASSVRYTGTKPVISFSCNPSFYDHNIALSKAAEKHRNNLFIISDVLDDIVDLVEQKAGHKSKKSKGKRKNKSSKSKKAEGNSVSVAMDTESGKTKTPEAEKRLDEEAVTERKPQSSGKKSRRRKHRKRKSSSTGHDQSSHSAEAIDKTPNSTKAPSKTPTKTPTKDATKTPSKDAELPITAKTALLSPSAISNENSKVDKQVKRLKKLKKKVMSSSGNDNPVVPGPSPVKKPKQGGKSTSGASVAEQSQAKIKIAFSNSGKLSSTTKSKWDSSSDEEGSSRKGAISYRFSDDESDTEKPEEKVTPVKKPPGANPFGKMQSGGMLKTIEMHNPLPDTKPSVPLAHPNPGPDRTSSHSRSRSRSRSYSRSRSRSRSSSYSSDDSYYRSRRRRRGKRRRSYSKSYSRSRSRSYSTSRSRSRSYSRSYSRSTSRSRSRYRSYSRSSYSSYSSRSYSSRSRSRSPRYTRAVQPKYNNTRAYNLGKRKKFKKKNQFKNQNQQNPHQNPNIQKQLETGRAKAEETVMRLKKQKEEQQDLQKRAMASIAAAASSAGISLPTTSAPTTAVSTMKTNGASPSDATAGTTAVTSTTPSATATPVNGTADLLNTFEDASRKAAAPDFVPRAIQSREFIGPVRPGMDSDIPLPEGTPRSSHSRDANSVPQEIKPMEAPDQNDEMFRELQEQAKQHVQATTSSPASDQLQQLAMAQYNPGVAAIPQEVAQPQPMFAIDPLTGQPVQIAPVHAAQIQQQQQIAMAQQAAQLQQQQQQAQVTSQSPQSAEGELTGEDGKPAPHEAVIKSYAHQIFMSQQKALVSQSQPVFAMASSSSTTTVPQAGVPIQAATATPTSVPVAVTPAQAAQLQLQAQVQQMQQAQAQAAAHAQAQAQAAAQAQAIQMQQIQQMQMAASLGLTQPGLALQQQLMAQQQLIAQQQAAAQGLQQVIQLPNGQVVLANPGAAAGAAAAAAAHPLLLQRFARPM